MTTKTLRTVLGLAFVGALIGLGVLGRFQDNTADRPNAELTGETASAAAPSTSPPAVEIDAAAMEGFEPASTGFERSELGARAAAVAYLEVTEDVVALTPAEAAEAQRSISTAASADRLAGEVEEQMVALIAQSPQGVRVWLAPMEARSVEIDGGYEVSIWYAEVVAIGTATVVDNWRTITYVLLWEDETWLIDDTVSVLGPVPARGALTVTPPATLVSLLSTFDDEGLAS